MNTKCATNCNIMSLTMLMMLCVVGVSGIPVFGQEHGEHGEGSRNWELMIGGGSFYKPEYSGADEMKFEPVPLVVGFYETERFRLFVEGDKARASLKFGGRVPLTLSAGVGMGRGRDNEAVSILEGTPTLENPVRVFSEVELDLSLFKLSSTLNYFPISADYDEAARSDVDYDGMLVDVGIKKEWMKIPFIVMLGGGLSWMNSDYAEANYGVAYPTANLESFTSESGMHSVNLSSNIIMFFHEHVGTMLMAEGKHLIDDAADSPVVEQKFQGEISIFGFYRF